MSRLGTVKEIFEFYVRRRKFHMFPIIILGGGVSNIHFLYDEGKNAVYDKVFSDLIETPILKNSLSDSAGVFGACLLNS